MGLVFPHHRTVLSTTICYTHVWTAEDSLAASMQEIPHRIPNPNIKEPGPLVSTLVLNVVPAML